MTGLRNENNAKEKEERDNFFFKNGNLIKGGVVTTALATINANVEPIMSFVVDSNHGIKEDNWSNYGLISQTWNLYLNSGASNLKCSYTDEEFSKELINNIYDDKNFIYDLDLVNDNECRDEKEFYDKYINIEKTSFPNVFCKKLKHFFILSVAGKPIYSLHGSTEILINYMAVITTIIGSLQKLLDSEIRSILLADDVGLLVLCKGPLIYVLISKIKHELLDFQSLSSDCVNEKVFSKDNPILMKQLNFLHIFFLSVFSNLKIKKLFNKGLNYDLGNLLPKSTLNFFDKLCMKMTFGFDDLEFNSITDLCDFEFFIGLLLNSLPQNLNIRTSDREKLDDILININHYKLEQEHPSISIYPTNFIFKIKNNVSSDLLLACFITGNKILSLVCSKFFSLSNEDGMILIETINSIKPTETADFSDEKRFPICLPNFNLNCYLYVYLKFLNLKNCLSINNDDTEPIILTLVLISKKKDSFYDLKNKSKFIINTLFNNKPLIYSLIHCLKNEKFNIKKEVDSSLIDHFIYNSKVNNQFVLEDFNLYNKLTRINHTIKLTNFYSLLHNSKYKNKKSKVLFSFLRNNKDKITFLNWTVGNRKVIGIHIYNDTEEILCLSFSQKNINKLISQCLKTKEFLKTNQSKLFCKKNLYFK